MNIAPGLLHRGIYERVYVITPVVFTQTKRRRISPAPHLESTTGLSFHSFHRARWTSKFKYLRLIWMSVFHPHQSGPANETPLFKPTLKLNNEHTDLPLVVLSYLNYFVKRLSRALISSLRIAAVSKSRILTASSISCIFCLISFFGAFLKSFSSVSRRSPTAC